MPLEADEAVKDRAVLTRKTILSAEYVTAWNLGRGTFQIGAALEVPESYRDSLKEAWTEGWFWAAREKGREADAKAHTLAFILREPDRLQMAVYLRSLATRKPPLVTVMIDFRATRALYLELWAVLDMLHPDTNYNLIFYGGGWNLHYAAPSLDMLRRPGDGGWPTQKAGNGGFYKALRALNGDKVGNAKERGRIERFAERGYLRQGSAADSPIIVLTCDTGEHFCSTDAFEAFETVGRDNLFVISA